jgi:hypothetical protein
MVQIGEPMEMQGTTGVRTWQCHAGIEMHGTIGVGVGGKQPGSEIQGAWCVAIMH